MAITPPWTSTFNCDDWDTRNNITCDGFTRWSDSLAGGTTTSKIRSTYNNPSGGGYKGLGVAVNDGVNDNGGTPKVYLNDSYPELWVRWYMKYPLGFAWSGSAPAYHKWIYFNIIDGEDTSSCPVWGLESDNLIGAYIYGKSDCGTGYVNCIIPPPWYQDNYGFFYINGGWTGDGKWHCYEIHQKVETGEGLFDGVGEVWIDGVRVINDTAVNYGTLIGWSCFEINTNQSNPSNGGIVYIEWDDMAIRTDHYIGPLSSNKTPSTPQNILINSNVRRLHPKI